MEITIDQTQEQALLQRKQITAHISQEGVTPTRIEVVDALAEKLSVKPETVVVQHIQPSFGDASLHVECYVYDSPELMKRLERENLLQKHVRPEPEPEPEQPAEEAAPAAEPTESAEQSTEEAAESEAEKTE